MSVFDRAILVRVEITKGTERVPTPALDAVRVQTLKANPAAAMIERSSVKNTMGMLPRLVGRKTIEVAADVLLRGSGVLGALPDVSALLRCCGFFGVVNAGVSVVYHPATNGLKSVTCYVYDDGQLFKVLGAVGNVSIDAQINQPLKASFSLKAGFDIAPTVADAPVPIYVATDPILMTQASVVTDGGVIRVGAFKFDSGNEFGDHHTTGQNEFTVSNRKPTITITKDSVGTVADWNAMLNSDVISLSASFGSIAGNKLVIAASNCRAQTPKMGERNERITREIVFDCYETAGDDQFSITFE